MKPSSRSYLDRCSTEARKDWRCRGTLLLALILVQPSPVTPARISVGGDCALVDAITAANGDQAGNGCSAGSGADTIELTESVLLTAALLDENGLPRITSVIELEGNGFTIERETSAPDFRLFEVMPGATLRLDNVVLSSGSVSLEGGAILNGGTLELTNTEVTGSAATYGGAINNGGSTVLAGSTLSDNYARGYGGGIYTSYFGSVVVTDSTITRNYAGWSGGGVFSYAGVAISGSTISENEGSGIHLRYQPSTIIDSAIHDNTGHGVSIAVSSELTLMNSTVSGNGGNGVDIYQAFGDGFFDVFNSSLVGNSQSGAYAGPYSIMTLTNTVVALNAESSCAGPVLDGSGNFDDDGTCPGTSAITGLDPVLADNGGPTYTHALLTGSSAIDQTPDCGLLTDQRGLGRDTECDSGAFEFDAAPAVGAAAEGLSSQIASCSNLETSNRVEIPGAASWNCRTSGLEITSGDRVRQDVRGQPDEAVILGSVDGLDGARVTCRNLSTGQAVRFPLAAEGAWNCSERGLLFSTSDRVGWTVVGEAQ